MLKPVLCQDEYDVPAKSSQQTGPEHVALEKIFILIVAVGLDEDAKKILTFVWAPDRQVAAEPRLPDLG
jgi:hypothetical protein